MKKIKFVVQKELEDILPPSPMKNHIPQWYKDADRFAKMPNGEYYIAGPNEICPHPKEGTTDDYGKMPTWKACPAVFDVLGTGYSLNLPCDIEFIQKDEKTFVFQAARIEIEFGENSFILKQGGQKFNFVKD